MYFGFFSHFRSSTVDLAPADEVVLRTSPDVAPLADTLYRAHHVVIVGFVGFAVGVFCVLAVLALCYRRLPAKSTSPAAGFYADKTKSPGGTLHRRPPSSTGCSLNERHAAKLNNYWTLPRPPPPLPTKQDQPPVDLTTATLSARRSTPHRTGSAPYASLESSPLGGRSPHRVPRRQPSLPAYYEYRNRPRGDFTSGQDGGAAMTPQTVAPKVAVVVGRTPSRQSSLSDGRMVNGGADPSPSIGSGGGHLGRRLSGRQRGPEVTGRYSGDGSPRDEASALTDDYSSTSAMPLYRRPIYESVVDRAPNNRRTSSTRTTAPASERN